MSHFAPPRTSNVQIHSASQSRNFEKSWLVATLGFALRHHISSIWVPWDAVEPNSHGSSSVLVENRSHVVGHVFFSLRSRKRCLSEPRFLSYEKGVCFPRRRHTKLLRVDCDSIEPKITKNRRALVENSSNFDRVVPPTKHTQKVGRFPGVGKGLKAPFSIIFEPLGLKRVGIWSSRAQ